jgi:hypothetical protein
VIPKLNNKERHSVNRIAPSKNSKVMLFSGANDEKAKLTDQNPQE